MIGHGLRSLLWEFGRTLKMGSWRRSATTCCSCAPHLVGALVGNAGALEQTFRFLRLIPLLLLAHGGHSGR